MLYSLPAAQTAGPINPFLIGTGNCTTPLALCAALDPRVLSLSGTYLLAAMFDHEFPCRTRPLPSHAPQDRLSCPFATSPTIRRGCHPLRLAKTSISCHGVCIKQEGLVFLRIFNTFVLFNVGDSPFIALESFGHSCF
jgi:hypothetical protein